jgi:hypothetical protein
MMDLSRRLHQLRLAFREIERKPSGPTLIALVRIAYAFGPNAAYLFTTSAIFVGSR